MTRTLHMAWEFVEPLYDARDGSISREGFWKCTKMTNQGREDVQAWVQMPLTDGGYTRKSAVVEISSDRAIMLQDRAIPDEAFLFSVIRHDLTASEAAA